MSAIDAEEPLQTEYFRPGDTIRRATIQDLVQNNLEESPAPRDTEPSPTEEKTEDSEIIDAEDMFIGTTTLVEGLSPTDVKIVEAVLNQKTPVELGFVPPDCENFTPSNTDESGVETVPEGDSDSDGDVPRPESESCLQTRKGDHCQTPTA